MCPTKASFVAVSYKIDYNELELIVSNTTQRYFLLLATFYYT
jgi:hypothetical protein